MKNKEFVSELSQRIGIDATKTSRLIEHLVSAVTQELQDGNSVTISEFGSFGVKKKDERIIVNPATQQRMLVPPKLVASFKPNSTLKEKFK